MADRYYNKTINYYRLTQVDFDGERETFKSISIDNNIKNEILLKTVNLMGQDVNEYYTGIVIEYYESGLIIKRYRE